MDTISEVYRYLESNVNGLKTYDTYNSLSDLREIFKDEDLHKLIVEIAIGNFFLDEGEVKPMLTGGGTEYPSYSGLLQKDYEYIKTRANEVKNKFLKARYNQVLWKSPIRVKSKNIYCERAIDLYIEILEKIQFGEDQNKENYEYFVLYKNAYLLAKQIAYKVDVLIELGNKWILEQPFYDNTVRIMHIKFIVENRGKKMLNFQEYADLVYNYGKLLLDSRSKLRNAIDTFEVGRLIAPWSDKNSAVWDELIGDCFMELSIQRSVSDDTNMIPLKFCNDAIKCYKLANIKEKILEAEQLYSKLKTDLNLSKVELTFELDKEIIQNRMAFISSGNFIDLYDRLATNHSLFPAINKPSPYLGGLDLFTRMKFDANNHLLGPELTESSKNYELYGMMMGVNINLIVNALRTAVSNGTHSFDNFMLYLKNYTWLNNELDEISKDSEILNYTWTDQIQSALEYSFEGFKIDAVADTPVVNYGLAIDSLVVKLEGMLRDVLYLHELSTGYQDRGGNMRAKNLEAILAEEKIKDLMGKENMYFFQYFFSSNGWNIRNNVAHSFYKAREYDISKIVIILIAILKIGKLRVPNKTGQV